MTRFCRFRAAWRVFTDNAAQVYAEMILTRHKAKTNQREMTNEERAIHTRQTVALERIADALEKIIARLLAEEDEEGGELDY